MLFLSLPRPGTRLDLNLPPSVSFPVSSLHRWLLMTVGLIPRQSTCAFLKCAGSQAGVEAVADPSTDRRVKVHPGHMRPCLKQDASQKWLSSCPYLWSHCS